MANLSFLDLQNEVYSHTGLDSTDSTNQTNVKRWLNYTTQDICAKWPWPFMEGRETVVTVPDYTTGTISITVGGTTVTGVGTTFTSGMANQSFIQFNGSNDWYRIATFTGVGQVSIDTPYAGLTNLSGTTFIIRKMFYSLSSSCDRIIDIRNWQTPLKLVNVDPRVLDDLRPNPQSTNSSYGYLAWGYDTSGNIQVSPYPFPSDARLLELRTTKRPVDMSGDSDVPSIPNKYAHLIAWGGNALAFASMRKMDIASAWNSKLDQRIEEMKKEYRMSEDEQPIMRSIDSVQRAKWLQLPEQYPAVTN